MSREATSFEGVVSSFGLEGGVIWATINMAVPKTDIPDSPIPLNAPVGFSNSCSTVREPYFHCYIPASDLPGISVGDKVQVALYLK